MNYLLARGSREGDRVGTNRQTKKKYVDYSISICGKAAENHRQAL